MKAPVGTRALDDPSELARRRPPRSQIPPDLQLWLLLLFGVPLFIIVSNLAEALAKWLVPFFL